MLALGLALAMIAVPAAQGANEDYNHLNGVTLGDTPWTAASDFTQTFSFDNAAFDAEPEYSASAPQFAGCGGWGARSGWVRFATAVEGRLFVAVETGYDVFYSVYTAPTSIPPGTATLGQLTAVDCQNAVSGAGNENYIHGYAIPRDRVAYLQVLSVCAARTELPACSEQERAAAPGGPTTVSFRFDPRDDDQDNTADTLDACPAQAGPAGGCPDQDGDGVGDPSDACPTVKGSGQDGCRIPDEDKDGYDANATDVRVRDCDDDDPAVHPGADEVRGNTVDEDCDGLAAFDADGDGYDDKPGPDCDPGNKRINPGAKEIPGNRVDEDCDGKKAPFPRVRSQVAPNYLKTQGGRGRTAGFAYFAILPAVKGMRIRLECSGANCPFSAKVYRVRKSRGQQRVGREFNGRALPVGAEVTVRMSRPGYIGRVLRYTLRKGRGEPKLNEYCTLPGSTKLRSSC